MDLKPYNEQEFNKLCAEFLFPELIDIDDTGVWGINRFKTSRVPKILKLHYSNIFQEHDLKFHSDWNWIMEVVEKIDNIFVFEDYSVSMTLETHGLSIITVHYYQPDRTKQKIIKQFTSISKNKKEAVVEAIWEFLQWYNEQKS